jgi:hypothetical protein
MERSFYIGKTTCIELFIVLDFVKLQSISAGPYDVVSLSSSMTQTSPGGGNREGCLHLFLFVSGLLSFINRSFWWKSRPTA